MAFPVAVEHRPLELTHKAPLVRPHRRAAAGRAVVRADQTGDRPARGAGAPAAGAGGRGVLYLRDLARLARVRRWLAQERTGRGGRRFRMFKLRTMVHNAHELKAKYMHLNEHSYPDFKITNDPTAHTVRPHSPEAEPRRAAAADQRAARRDDTGRAAPDLVQRRHLSAVADGAARGHSGYHRPVAGHRRAIWTSTIGCGLTSPTSATGACGSTCESWPGRSPP